MSENDRTILVITADIDPAYDRQFNEWYDNEHLPEVIGCEGFISGRRMVALDAGQTPRYVTCYEVAGPEVLETPEIRAVSGWGPLADKVVNYRRFWFKPVGKAIDGGPAGDHGG